MQIRTIAVRRINPAPYNPRRDLRPGEPAYERLLKSIEAFGCVEPLVWNERTGHLVGGHQRFKILVARGERRLQVSVVDLPLEKEKQLNLALNKIEGAWDEEMLSTLLAELTSLEGFDADVTGFQSSEIDRLLADSLQPDPPVPAIEPEPETPAVTQPGELIELGPHRVLCADATAADSLRALVGDQRIRLLHTDPPYNVAYDTANRPTGNARASLPIANDKQTLEQYREFTRSWLVGVKGVMAPGAAYYIWNGFANFGHMSDLLAGLKMRTRHVITWAKESFSPGFGDYNEQTEFCLYGCKAGGQRRWHGAKSESTLWRVTRDRTALYVHPTQKALPLAERAIRNSSSRGDVVLDPFLGSGTTLIAAARLGRVCYGLELSASYCDAIVRRYIATVGRDAVDPSIRSRWGRSSGDLSS